MVEEPDNPELLTLQEAAERLKVHYMTAYRWVRRGELAAFKAGGRLRVRAIDVDQFVRQRRVDVVLPGAGGRTDWPTHVERLYDLLADGRALDAGHLVRKVIADGAPVGQVYLDLITPALHRIGDTWAAGELSVAEEHRAAEICAGIIARHGEAFRRRGPSRGTAATMTPSNELHGIAAAMAADLLRGGGYEVHHLGVNVPAADLRLFLQVVPCDVLCVSLTTAGSDPRVYSEIVAAADSTVAVIFGGQGTEPDRADEAGGIVVESMADLVGSADRARTQAVAVSAGS